MMTLIVEFNAHVAAESLEILRQHPDMKVRLQFTLNYGRGVSPIVCDSPEDVLTLLAHDRKPKELT